MSHRPSATTTSVDETDDLNRPFAKGDMKHPLLEESSFAVLFPHYRERYLTENWPRLEQIFQPLGISAKLDCRDGVMVVRTTNETWDPVAILRARDVIKLLARSVPLEQAVRVLEDGMECLIHVIGRDIRNSDRFAKRRQRLIGPNGDTLKALELLTQCYILVQGHTIAAIGNPRGLETVQKVATDCMDNVHPVYHIKTLMVRRELEKRPELADQDWDRYLPKFRKLSKPNKGKKAKREYRNRSILPDFPPDTELDRQIESGEFFQKQKAAIKRKGKKHRPAQGAEEPPADEAPTREDGRSIGTALELAREIAERKRGTD
jgi:ribosomal RNA assembly protein